MLRKSKKGFTLIELMVVAVIIAVLAVLGLRVYSGQVDKAKNAVVKANVGTVQTLIQGELADEEVSTVANGSFLDNIVSDANIYNPVTHRQQTSANYAISEPSDIPAGEVYVWYADNVFHINGNDATSDFVKVFDDPLRAIK